MAFLAHGTQTGWHQFEAANLDADTCVAGILLNAEHVTVRRQLPSEFVNQLVCNNLPLRWLQRIFRCHSLVKKRKIHTLSGLCECASGQYMLTLTKDESEAANNRCG